MSFRLIKKVGLAAVEGNRLLVVRKRGDTLYILPGGKPEGTESDLETLARELREELGCEVSSTNYMGEFSNRAAGTTNAAVVVRLYGGRLVGEPSPQSEIEQIAWVDIDRPRLPLAPSIAQQILPHLRKRLQEAGEGPKAGQEARQQRFELQ